MQMFALPPRRSKPLLHLLTLTLAWLQMLSLLCLLRVFLPNSTGALVPACTGDIPTETTLFRSGYQLDSTVANQPGILLQATNISLLGHRLKTLAHVLSLVVVRCPSLPHLRKLLAQVLHQVVQAFLSRLRLKLWTYVLPEVMWTLLILCAWVTFLQVQVLLVISETSLTIITRAIPFVARLLSG
ncbi:hypothetical protein BKA82DRAFT_2874885 [Pisolithus tinctorius]|nr:hypothetical protein BKA82DRAFT_2874885 [Pisolithus tinctorius]